LTDAEPIKFPPRQPLSVSQSAGAAGSGVAPTVRFDRRELNTILKLYGRMVAAGEWRDYAMDFLRDRAVFSVFRRSSEVPLYRIEKTPALLNRQGAYSVVAAGGLIMKRGQDLERVLRVLDKGFYVVSD
jgi:Protein of unknown function (DUF2794)